MNYSYIGVSRRTFQQAIVHLLETEYGFINSPRVLAMLAEDIQQLAKQFFPADVSVHPGWLVFTGTKATGPKAHPARTAGDYTLVTISWPVLLPEDSLALAKMPPGRAGSKQRDALFKQRLQRIIEHGEQHPDGPVLLTLTDLALMLGCNNSQVSVRLKELRQESGKPLLTKVCDPLTKPKSWRSMKKAWMKPTSPVIPTITRAALAAICATTPV